MEGGFDKGGAGGVEDGKRKGTRMKHLGWMAVCCLLCCASCATEKAGGLGPASIEVQIRGDVIRPGNYTVEEGFSLGGLLDMAEPIHREDPWLRPDLRRVMLWRDVDGQRKEMRLNCTDGMPGRDFLLQDGDEVLVTHPF